MHLPFQSSISGSSKESVEIILPELLAVFSVDETADGSRITRQYDISATKTTWHRGVARKIRRCTRLLIGTMPPVLITHGNMEVAIKDSAPKHTHHKLHVREDPLRERDGADIFDARPLRQEKRNSVYSGAWFNDRKVYNIKHLSLTFSIAWGKDLITTKESTLSCSF